jgi:Zn-dependent protease with chaperone function
MHLLMILAGLSTAWWFRLNWREPTGTWTERWQRSLALFLLSPLLLLMTAIAVVCMGPHGRMVWKWEGWLCYELAIATLCLIGLCWLWLTWQGMRTQNHLQRYTSVHIPLKTRNSEISSASLPPHSPATDESQVARLLDTSKLYSARVGFWNSELVVSQGLLDKLDPEHLEAVLLHEQAHVVYRDTFWFFWLGWLRRCTAWLPNTEALWQELLLLRELRADRWAAQHTEPLLVAESLLQVISAPLLRPELCAPFSSVTGQDRLTQRIEALLTEPTPITRSDRWFWIHLFWVLLPLVVVPFHS